MNCRKARQLLNSKNAATDMKLINHLKNCPSCIRETRASEILESALHYGKEAPPAPETPFRLLREKVESLSKQKSIKEKTIMSRIMSEFNRRPRLAAGFGLALIAFLFVTLVPFSYMKTVGYSVSFDNVGPVGNQTAEQLTTILNAMGYTGVDIAMTGADIKISGLPTRQSAREAALVFEKLSGVNSEPAINQIAKKVSGSLYAQAVEKKRTIEIDAAGETDAQIEAEIVRQLAQAGYQANVSVMTDASGERKISIDMTKQGDGTAEEEKFIINCKDTGFTPAKLNIALPIQLSDIDAEGKTDEQIISEVKARLAQQGVADADVVVTPGPDGKKKIKVKVEKERR
jgi:hypothetical protein